VRRAQEYLDESPEEHLVLVDHASRSMQCYTRSELRTSLVTGTLPPAPGRDEPRVVHKQAIQALLAQRQIEYVMVQGSDGGVYSVHSVVPTIGGPVASLGTDETPAPEGGSCFDVGEVGDREIEGYLAEDTSNNIVLYLGGSKPETECYRRRQLLQEQTFTTATAGTMRRIELTASGRYYVPEAQAAAAAQSTSNRFMLQHTATSQVMTGRDGTSAPRDVHRLLQIGPVVDTDSTAGPGYTAGGSTKGYTAGGSTKGCTAGGSTKGCTAGGSAKGYTVSVAGTPLARPETTQCRMACRDKNNNAKKVVWYI
jgi:hypothetical protein